MSVGRTHYTDILVTEDHSYCFITGRGCDGSGATAIAISDEKSELP